jgi:hypothetical protein
MLNDRGLFAVALEDGFGRVADIGTRVVRAPTEDGRAMARLGVRAGCFRFLARPMPKLTKLL